MNWEESFAAQIGVLRGSEVHATKWAALVRSTYSAVAITGSF